MGGGGGGKKTSKRARKKFVRGKVKNEDPEHDHFKVLFNLRATLYNPQNDLKENGSLGVVFYMEA